MLGGEIGGPAGSVVAIPGIVATSLQ